MYIDWTDRNQFQPSYLPTFLTKPVFLLLFEIFLLPSLLTTSSHRSKKTVVMKHSKMNIGMKIKFELYGELCINWLKNTIKLIKVTYWSGIVTSCENFIILNPISSYHSSAPFNIKTIAICNPQGNPPKSQNVLSKFQHWEIPIYGCCSKFGLVPDTSKHLSYHHTKKSFTICLTVHLKQITNLQSP